MVAESPHSGRLALQLSWVRSISFAAIVHHIPPSVTSPKQFKIPTIKFLIVAHFLTLANHIIIPLLAN
jgi:hypothetical protein